MRKATDRRVRQAMPTGLAALASLACALLASASPARADGLAPVSRALAGPVDLTVLASPAPVQVGLTTWYVLVGEPGDEGAPRALPSELLSHSSLRHRWQLGVSASWFLCRLPFRQGHLLTCFTCLPICVLTVWFPENCDKRYTVSYCVSRTRLPSSSRVASPVSYRRNWRVRSCHPCSPLQGS